MSNTKDLISQLQQHNKDEHIDIFVPSLNKTSQFSPLTVHQQKELIKTALDGTISGVTLNDTLNNIILANSTDNLEFNIFDRYAIAIQLRASCIGNIYEFEKSKDKLNLTDHISNVYKDNTELAIKPKKIKQGPITVNVNVPTISRECKVNAIFIKNVGEHESAGNTISEMYIYEIVKFIKDITVGDGESFIFGNTNVYDCTRIIDNLPASVNQKIIKYMEEARDIENVCLNVNEENISIDASFFTSD